MSRFDAAAEDLRRINLEANATDSERARLIAEQDPNVILIRLAYSPSPDGNGPGDMLMRTDGMPADATATTLDDLGPNPSETARAIADRIRLRVALELPPRDCNARRQRADCHCLQESLDRLVDVEGVNRQWVVSLARDLHKRARAADRERKRAEKAQRKLADLRAKAAKETATDSRTPATRQAPTVKPTEAKPKPRYRLREPPHPLSIEAFRRSEGGPRIENIMDREF